MHPIKCQLARPEDLFSIVFNLSFYALWKYQKTTQPAIKLSKSTIETEQGVKYGQS